MTTQRQAIDNCTNNNDYNSSNDNSNNKNNNYKKRCFVFFNFNQIFWLQCISEATKNIISNVGTTTTTISTKKSYPVMEYLFCRLTRENDVHQTLLQWSTSTSGHSCLGKYSSLEKKRKFLE